MKRGLKNILLSLLGFSAAPILTACYGSPEFDEDAIWNRDFEGKVTNAEGAPIEGVKVYVGIPTYLSNELKYLYTPISSCEPAITNADGEFSIYVGRVKWGATFVAEDIDGEQNGLYNTTYEWLGDFDEVIVMEEATSEDNTNE